MSNPNPPALTPSGSQSYSSRARQYANDIVSGAILASKWTIAACKRHLTDLERPDFRFYFDEDAANRICQFAELLRHEKGKWAAKGELIKLEPWQCFVLCCIFGWLDNQTKLRRFREAFILIPRKNGKSILAAIIGLFMLTLDGEQGAEVYCGATSEKQALEVFRPAKHFVSSSQELRDATGVTAAAKSIYVPNTGGRFQPVIARPGDGSSPHCAIADEYHEHISPDQVDTFVTGMGARAQPLLLMTSTAGTNTEGPCRVKQSECERVLSCLEVNDRLFAIVYTADPDVDWTSEDALRMANPNYGISVEAEWLREQQASAVRNAYAQNTFRIKHLDQWVASKSAWLNSVDIDACIDESLDEQDYETDLCYIGLDLANKIDLAAMVRLYKRHVNSKDHYFCFSSAYLPESKVNAPGNGHFAAWAKQGWITATEGNSTDYAVIEADVLGVIKRANVQELCFDPWSATQFAQRISSETELAAVEVPQKREFLSPAAKELEALIADRRIHIQNDPVLKWCLTNLVAKEFRNTLVLDKEDPTKKIDCAMALITALVRGATAPVKLKGPSFKPFFM